MILYIQLLLSHILTDFYLQPNSWVVDKFDKKHRSPKLYWHVLLAGALAYACCAKWTWWWIVPAVSLPHLFIDIWKLYMPQKNSYFIADQALHFTHLAILGLLIHQFTDHSTTLNNTMITEWLPQILIVSVGILLITSPAGILVGKLTQEYRDNLDEVDRSVSLPKAGKLIGILERIFVFIAIIIGQLSIVGFLIAAKSILRYSDSKYVNNPVRMSEYVIIGTLMSVLIAVLVALGCKFLMVEITK